MPSLRWRDNTNFILKILDYGLYCGYNFLSLNFQEIIYEYLSHILVALADILE